MPSRSIKRILRQPTTATSKQRTFMEYQMKKRSNSFKLKNWPKLNQPNWHLRIRAWRRHSRSSVFPSKRTTSTNCLKSRVISSKMTMCLRTNLTSLRSIPTPSIRKDSRSQRLPRMTSPPSFSTSLRLPRRTSTQTWTTTTYSNRSLKHVRRSRTPYRINMETNGLTLKTVPHQNLSNKKMMIEVDFRLSKTHNI